MLTLGNTPLADLKGGGGPGSSLGLGGPEGLAEAFGQTPEEQQQQEAAQPQPEYVESYEPVMAWERRIPKLRGTFGEKVVQKVLSYLRTFCDEQKGDFQLDEQVGQFRGRERAYYRCRCFVSVPGKVPMEPPLRPEVPAVPTPPAERVRPEVPAVPAAERPHPLVPALPVPGAIPAPGQAHPITAAVPVTPDADAAIRAVAVAPGMPIAPGIPVAITEAEAPARVPLLPSGEPDVIPALPALPLEPEPTVPETIPAVPGVARRPHPVVVAKRRCPSGYKLLYPGTGGQRCVPARTVVARVVEEAMHRNPAEAAAVGDKPRVVGSAVSEAVAAAKIAAGAPVTSAKVAGVKAGKAVEKAVAGRAVPPGRARAVIEAAVGAALKEKVRHAQARVVDNKLLIGCPQGYKKVKLTTGNYKCVRSAKKIGKAIGRRVPKAGRAVPVGPRAGRAVPVR